MSISHGSYLAYGLRVSINPYEYNDEGLTPGEQVGQALSVPTVRATCPDVGHLQAGAYDDDMFFLTTECHTAEIAEVHWIGSGSDGNAQAKRLDWDRQLYRMVEIMGWRELICKPHTAGWFIVTDES